MEVVMFHSYKGGSGKSFFTMNFAQILSHVYGKRTLVIESDFFMPILYQAFPQFRADVFLNTYLQDKDLHLSSCIYPSLETPLGYIFADPKFNPSERVFSHDLDWFDDTLKRLNTDINDLDYDYVLFDLSPGRHLFTVNAIILCSKIFIVMRPDVYSFKGTQQLINHFYSNVDLVRNKEIHILINQIPKTDKIIPLIERWEVLLSDFPNVRPHVHRILYEEETAFNIANGYIMLPDDDPNIEAIHNILKSANFKI